MGGIFAAKNRTTACLHSGGAEKTRQRARTRRSRIFLNAPGARYLVRRLGCLAPLQRLGASLGGGVREAVDEIHPSHSYLSLPAPLEGIAETG